MLADLTAGFEEVSQQTYREVELIEDEELLDAGMEPALEVGGVPPSGEESEEAEVAR